ncbi:MAG TPA: allophanate hydrolase [Acidimicrobiales bacterium]
MTPPSSDATTPTEAVARAYERLAAGQAAAWITVVPEEDARRAAQRLEDEGPDGRPLWGRTFAVKDNIDVAGLPTTAACPAFAYEATATAPAVQALLDAGAVLVGKTNLDQFATGLVGTRSPYGVPHSVLDATRVAGGSSSGSAVAVAEGVVDLALGTDTAGSGRVPAACNGIVGVKPSRGLIPVDGVVPACRSIDCVSLFSVEPAPGTGSWLPGSGARSEGARIGVPPPDQWGLAAPQEVAYRHALTGLGGVEVDLTPFLRAGELLYGPALVAERLTTIGPLLATDPDAVHPVVRRVVEPGLGATAVDVHRTHQRLADLRRRFDPVWDEVDVLVLPTVPDVPTLAEVEADPVGANAALGRWTNGVNLLDLCAVTVPAGVRPDGLPGSVTVVGPAGTDALAAAVAARIARPRASLAVVGAHLSGLPLNHQLTDRGAYLEAATRTAPVYRLFALETEPPKPGMVRVGPGERGAAVEAEVWSLDEAAFGSFVAEVPPPLSIGTVELADGRSVKGFLCEPSALVGAEDITAHGGWRAWLAAR